MLLLVGMDVLVLRPGDDEFYTGGSVFVGLCVKLCCERSEALVACRVCNPRVS